MDWNAITPLLTAKLDASHVKPPAKYGPKGDYIEGWHAIAEANRIFGFGAWSYEIKALDKVSLVEGQDGKGNPQWQAAYTCLVRLDVSGTVREDVGFGSGFSKQIGDAVEGATKEAVTDALKRALRTFGNPFGLALYDKSRANVGDAQADADAMSAAVCKARELIAKINATNSLDALNDGWGRCVALRDKIGTVSPDALADVEAAFNARHADLSTATPDLPPLGEPMGAH